MDERTDQLVEILSQIETGDSRRVDVVVSAAYDELRALAAYHLNRERPDHTLQPTALVHEAYLRLLQQREVDWKSRAHFVSIAAQQIRRVLIDHARKKGRVKRGGDLIRVTLSDGPAVEDKELEFLALNDLLDRLDTESPQDRTIVELKYFGGLTEAEIAAVLGIGERTVRRRWSFVRAWLYRELSDDPPVDPPGNPPSAAGRPDGEPTP